MNLRPYQAQIKEIARREFMNHDRLLVWLPTGAGKGVIMSNIVKDAVAKGRVVLTVVRMRQIVFQTFQNYDKAGIKSKFFMSNENPIVYASPTLSSIASIDTLDARIKSKYGDSAIRELRGASLVIIDEAHNCTSESYARFIWWLEGESLEDFTMQKFHDKTDYTKKYLGFSATPFAIGKKTHRFLRR